VEARIDGGWLEVAVSDTGPGFRPPAPEGERRGVGLENVRRRLRLCYGDEARLDIVSGASGTRVGFRVPAARASAA
jgi:LytS/YehU family sensor histidine kinase